MLKGNSERISILNERKSKCGVNGDEAVVFLSVKGTTEEIGFWNAFRIFVQYTVGFCLSAFKTQKIRTQQIAF